MKKQMDKWDRMRGQYCLYLLYVHIYTVLPFLLIG